MSCRRTSVLVLAVLLWSLEAAAQAPLGCPAAFELRVVELVNAERAARGIAALDSDVRLVEAAQLHADDMATLDFVSHTGSDGSTMRGRIEAAGYLPWYRIAENVAAGYTSPEAVVSAWMASSGHRANILDPQLQDIGVGYAYAAGTRYRHYWVQDFGRTTSALQSPLDLCPACANGADDDGDGYFDWDGAGRGAPDPECGGDPSGRERAPACGLGAELGLVLAPLAFARRRRRGRSNGRDQRSPR